MFDDQVLLMCDITGIPTSTLKRFGLKQHHVVKYLIVIGRQKGCWSMRGPKPRSK